MKRAEANFRVPDEANGSPFVRFDCGTVFPPNTLYESSEALLQRLSSTTLEDAFEGLITRGPLNGTFGVLNEATWFSVLERFLLHAGVQSKSQEDLRINALKLMLIQPSEKAWSRLRAFLVANADALSGWEGSIRKDLAERRGVIRGEDGLYYIQDQMLNRTQILGVGTLAEDRIDFLTNQLTISSGTLYQVVSLFSLFAISADFRRHPTHYHRLIKAIVRTESFASVGCEWTFMHFDYSRTYSWRPSSNLCDPKWLIGETLGELTDTLDIDFWSRSYESSNPETQWLQDGLLFQMDYVLDTELVIGGKQSAFIAFEDKVLRWINGTPERDATISISVHNLQDHLREDEQLNRFLSLLVWTHGQHARIKWGVGGARTAHSKAYSARRAGSMRVDTIYLQFSASSKLSTEQRLALGLYREAQNASSTFYEFLSYYKILELAVPNRGNTQRGEWLERVAIPKLSHMERLKEILSTNSSLEEYLREAKVNGIKHAIKGTIDADNPADQIATTKDNRLMHEIAQLVMRLELSL